MCLLRQVSHFVNVASHCFDWGILIQEISTQHLGLSRELHSNVGCSCGTLDSATIILDFLLYCVYGTLDWNQILTR
jgi:hypothetical protein